MIPKEVLQNIRRIQIKTSRLVNELFAGQYESVFKGRGIEFEEVREYIPGDDIRTIDWNVTARYGRPFIKKFIEERELTIMFLVDVSGSQRFGSSSKLKTEVSAEITALLSLAANKNHDKIGLITFTDNVEKYIPPKKGLKHVLRVIREVVYSSHNGRGTNIHNALEYLNKVARKKVIVFILSDFIDTGYEKVLSITSKHHDVICINTYDTREKEIPAIGGLVYLEDQETGEKVLINTKDFMFKKRFSELAQKREEELISFAKSKKIDFINIDVAKPYTEPLIAFFRLRERRFK